MIKKCKVLLFPALTVLFLFSAWFFGGEALTIAIKGERSEGNIVALVRCYEERCDLLVDITQELTLEQADGAVISAFVNREGIQRLDDYAKEHLTALNAVKGGKADGIQRFLQREADKESDERIVSVLRTERAMLIPGLPTPSAAPKMLDAPAATNRDEVITTIQFTYIGGTDEEAELKTNVRRDVSRTLNGKPVEHDSQDFILHEKDYRYSFRPVFTYQTAQGSAVVLADIATRKSPRGGHRLGDAILAGYMPETPEKAIMLSDFSSLKGRTFLDSINEFFNLTFGRWFFSTVSLLLAFVYFGMSWITISLTIKPPKTENADTVDKEALKRMS